MQVKSLCGYEFRTFIYMYLRFGSVSYLIDLLTVYADRTDSNLRIRKRAETTQHIVQRLGLPRIFFHTDERNTLVSE